MSCDITSSLDTFIRGNGFTLTCTYKLDGEPAALTDLTIRSQVRDSVGELIEELTVGIADQAEFPGVFGLISTDTTAWPIDRLKCDIQFIDSISGNKRNSSAFYIPVAEGVTHDS
jgi:hypothetical protein